MELIRYDKSNTQSKGIQVRSIRVSTYGGLITFSSLLVKELDLKVKDRIVFFQDGKDPKKWFFSLMDSSDLTAFELKNNSEGINFRCKVLTNHILKSFKEEKGMRFLIAKEAKEMSGLNIYQLIPMDNKISQRKNTLR